MGGGVFMEKRKKKFEPSFKKEAVRLAEGKTDRQVERELGLYQGAIGQWRKELQGDPENAFPGTGRMKPLEEENRRLRRELAGVREERDILKKAIAIFSERAPKTSTGS
jgi:transposase